MNILKILTPRRKLGNFGEACAVKHLRKRGYRILVRNFVGNHGEIDIIAKKDSVWAFIEVKTRSVESQGLYESRPAASVTPEKQRRLIRVANEYARKNYKPSKYCMRMDVIEVLTLNDKRSKPRLKSVFHIENAFDMDSAYRV